MDLFGKSIMHNWKVADRNLLVKICRRIIHNNLEAEINFFGFVCGKCLYVALYYEGWKPW